MAAASPQQGPRNGIIKTPFHLPWLERHSRQRWFPTRFFREHFHSITVLATIYANGLPAALRLRMDAVWNPTKAGNGEGGNIGVGERGDGDAESSCEWWREVIQTEGFQWRKRGEIIQPVSMLENNQQGQIWSKRFITMVDNLSSSMIGVRGGWRANGPYFCPLSSEGKYEHELWCFLNHGSGGRPSWMRLLI